MAASSQQLFKSLLDLHNDYLESIFRWLNLKDLLTMCRVSGRFEDSVNTIIAKRYAKDWIKITFFEYDTYINSSEVLVLSEMSQIIPFLRCFGSSISKLKVRFDEKKLPQCLAVEEYILQFCDGLKELQLEHCRKGAFDKIETPFEEIEVFSFSYGHLEQNFSQFNKWFPILRHLTIIHAIVANKYCIEETMPFLEHLEVVIGLTSKRFSQENIDEAIRSNPHLRSYCVNNGCKPRDLCLINRELKQLEKLEFWIHPENFEKRCRRSIIFKEMKNLTLDIYDRERVLFDPFVHDSSNKFLVCPKLEELEVRCYYLQERYFEFALENTLKKLTMLSQYDGPSINFMMKYASHWPNLTEVTIQVDCLSADEIVKFIKACMHLQRLNISDESEDITPKIEELNTKLPQEWKVVSMITKCYFYDFEHSIIRKSTAS